MRLPSNHAVFSACWILFLTSALVEGQENEISAATVSEETNTNAPNKTTTNSNEIGSNGHEYVVELKFLLKKEKTPEFISQVLFKNLSNHNVTTRDLISVTKIESVDLSTAESILNVSLGSLVDLPRLESVFTALDISIYSVYKDLFNTLIVDPRDKLPKILGMLGIDRNVFMDVIIFGNDEDLFNLLRQADLSAENLQKIFTLADLDMEKMYEFMKPILLTKLKLYPLSQFIVDMKEHGINQTVFTNILRKLDLSTLDYYKNGAFNDVFINFVKKLNGNGMVGAVTGERRIVTALSVYDKFRKNQEFAHLLAEVADNRELKFSITEFFLFWTNGPVSMQADTMIKTQRIEIANNYDVPVLNCTYVTVSNGQVMEKTILHTIVNNKYLIKIMKNDDIKFRVGSLLVCNEKLYGVARKEDNTHIQFSTFYWVQRGEDSEPSEELVTDKTWNSSPHLRGSTLLAIFTVLVLFAK